MPELTFDPRSAFHGLLPLVRSNVGVRVEDRDGTGMATVVVRPGRREMLRAALRSAHRLNLREGPVLSLGDAMLLVGIGVDSWLAVATADRRNLSAELVASLGESASVSDQSDGYGLLRISGDRTLDALRRLVPIDLHPSVFPAGSAASTLAAHIPLIVWRLNEETFELAVFRSYAASFMHALNEAALPFGLGLEPLGRR